MANDIYQIDISPAMSQQQDFDVLEHKSTHCDKTSTHYQIFD